MKLYYIILQTMPTSYLSCFLHWRCWSRCTVWDSEPTSYLYSTDTTALQLSAPQWRKSSRLLEFSHRLECLCSVVPDCYECLKLPGKSAWFLSIVRFCFMYARMHQILSAPCLGEDHSINRHKNKLHQAFSPCNSLKSHHFIYLHSVLTLLTSTF